jgi:exodeoxyribonuclease V alpha subunit
MSQPGSPAFRKELGLRPLSEIKAPPPKPPSASEDGSLGALEDAPLAAARGARAASAKAATATPVGDGEMTEIEGVVESLSYRSEETGYTVARVQAAGRADPVTVVGTCAAIWVGENLRASGTWVRHKQFGLQFQAGSIMCIAPTSATGIERYLASGMIRGVGKATAALLVKRFGADTLRVIEKESQRLEEVKGIGPTKRKQIKDAWIEQKAVRDIMIFLQGHGVGTGQSARIYRQYGNDAIAVITEDPYRLCRDVWGIGFKTADRVAASLGVSPQSEVRARAGLIYTLQTMTDEGHCFCPLGELVLQAQALLDIPAEILTEALRHEIHKGRLVNDRERIYLRALHEAEEHVAAKLRRLQATAAAFPPIVVDKALPWAEARMGIRFATAQAEAVRMALSEKVSVITGGPGVGKTTIIRALVDVFGARKLKLHLAAPTGRAAKRMEEATGREAKTIHRLLRFMPLTGSFDHGPGNPIEGDVFILDEVSMVDLPLMHALLGALPDAASLVLVGDVDQLPSVGPGNVLRDVIESGVPPCTRLDTIFRQESRGWIVENAHRINRGESIEVADRDDESDFYFFEVSDPDQAIRTVLDLVTERIPKRFGFDPMVDIQVLTPMRRNQLGAENLNVVLQERLNPTGPHVQRFGRLYRVGDRVMQIRNNYDKDVFNGDVGRISAIETDAQTVTVNFDGRRISYDLSDLDELIHAYACSIHKSQGSEYPAVVVLMTTQHFRLLQRNLLYTGITRGRKLVCVVGSRKALWIAIRNNEIRLRRTALAERLRETARCAEGVIAPPKTAAREPAEAGE